MMLIDARQVTAAANRMLAAARAGAVSLDELRDALAESRAFMAAGAAFQTAAAELIARRERHGDGGVEVLAASAGLSQREAQTQVVTAAALQKVPELRDAVQAGDVSQANARKLAEAITKTGSDVVAGDAELLAKAQSMRPEQFARTAQRWIGAQQSDDGTAEYLRQRARRYLRMYDTDDGMVALHGEFDKITGTRLHNRLRHTANRLLAVDKKLPETERRKFPQCMADALQHYTAGSLRAEATNNKDDITSGAGCGCAQQPDSTDAATSTVVGEGAGSGDASSDNSVSGITGTGGKVASTGSGDTVASVCECGAGHSKSPPACAGTCAAVCDSSDDSACSVADAVSAGEGAGGGWIADITVLAHVDDATGKLIGEFSDGSRLPATVLDALSCNARWTGLVFDRAGDAIWRSRSRRTVTDTQWQALLATYGGCFHCGAPSGMCQAHHITPYSKGGATSLENLIMVCWNCHHKIHHHNWQIKEHSDGSHTLHPPDHTVTQPRYGPAHADDPTPEASRTPARTRTQKSRARTETRTRGTMARARDPALW